MCENLAKMLLLRGAAEKQLSQHLGTVLGSRHGGWQTLFGNLLRGRCSPGQPLTRQHVSHGRARDEAPCNGTTHVSTAPTQGTAVGGALVQYLQPHPAREVC